MAVVRERVVDVGCERDDDNGAMDMTMRSGGFGVGARVWLVRIVLTVSAVAGGTACALVTSAKASFECAALHGGSTSDGNMGSFADVCASDVSAGRLILLGALGFWVIVLTESIIMWLSRRFPDRCRATRLIGTGWTPFLLYVIGVWVAHGLASGAWFEVGNSWLPVSEFIVGANAVAAWDIEGMRTLPLDRVDGIVTPVSRIGVDAAKRNVMLCMASVAVLTATQFGDLGLVVTGTGIPVLVTWIAVLACAIVVSALLRRAESPSDYGKVMIAQQVMSLLCAAALCVACLSDASRIAGLMTH